MFKRLLSFCLVFCLIFPLSTQAKDYQLLTTSQEITIIEVVDGHAAIGKTRNNELVLLKLSGIEPMASEASLEFLHREILGKTVYCAIDHEAPKDERWNLVFIYTDAQRKESINEKMLAFGLAIQSDLTNRSGKLFDAERSAKESQTGVWKDGFLWKENQFSLPTLNIHLASKETLSKVLPDIPSKVIENIITYRQRKVFRTIQDLNFVTGFTPKMFLTYRDTLAIQSNIQTVSKNDMLGWELLTEEEVLNIIDHRTQQPMKNISELYHNNLIPRWKYTQIEPFIYVGEKEKIMTPNVVLNINTASAKDLEKIGFSKKEASYIADNQNNTYSIKSAGEILNWKNSIVDENHVEEALDNLLFSFNINRCSYKELEGLLRSETSLKNIQTIYAQQPFITYAYLEKILGERLAKKIDALVYYDFEVTSILNLNTASYEELLSAGFGETESFKIASKQKNMFLPKDVPITLGNKNKLVSLHTNFNTATEKELLSLHPHMTSSLANAIITYRDTHYFGSKNDIYKFFLDRKQDYIYHAIEPFITVY